MTDKELMELSNKVRLAIKLENPDARFIVFLFAGGEEEETLHQTVVASCGVQEQIAVIDSILSHLEEEEGIDRAKLLGSMITHGSATIHKEKF